MTDMPIREYDIEIDIITGKVNVLNMPINNRIEFIKGDYRSNRLNIHLKSNGNPYLVGDNNVKVAFVRRDNEILIMNKDIDELYVVDGIIQCTLTPDVMEVAGRQVSAEVLIYDNEGRRLTSGRFSFYIIRGIIDDTKIKQVDGYDLLEKLTIQVENMLSDIEENVLPNEERRELQEELRELAEQGRVAEFNAKLIEISDAVNNAIEKANLANEKAGLAQQATDIINQTNEDIIQTENQREVVFTNMMTSADQIKHSLDLVIFDANSANDTLEANIVTANTLNHDLSNTENGTIKRANDTKNELDNSISNANIINNTLSDATNGTIKVANDTNDILEGTIDTANISKSELDESISEASTIESTLSNIETGTIKLATDVNQSLLNGIDDANTFKVGLDQSVQDGIDAKNALELAMQNGGVIYEDVDMLKGLRVYKGTVEPTDTSFWYDTSDNTGITRV